MSIRAEPAGDRYPCFDGLRALAAIAVLLHHASIATAYSLRGFRVPLTDGRFGEYFARMDAGVQVFFLISGFLLYRPFVAAAFASRTVDVRTFFRRRFLRIYPAYWVAFTGIALFIGIDMPKGGARSMLEYFFLVHLYDTSTVVTATGDVAWRALGGISQSWTLVVEISFYLFLPLYAAVMQRLAGERSPRARLHAELAGLAILYAVSVGWRAVAFWVVPDGSAFAFLGPYWLPAHFDLFAIGMGLGVLRAWADTRAEPPRLLRAVGRFDWQWWVLAAVSFHVVTFYVGLPAGLELVYGAKAYAKQFLYGLAALFLLLPAVFGPQDRGPVRRVLRWAPVAFLGTISYGIYLWHQGFIKKVHQWGGWDDIALPNGPFLVHAGGAFALTVVVATASWYLVERPLLGRKHERLLGRRAAAGARAAP